MRWIKWIIAASSDLATVCVFRLWSQLLLPVFGCLPLSLFQAIIRSSRRERSHILSLSEQFCYLFSFQFSRSVVSDSLRPHGLQHARPPCPSPTPGACSNSCPLIRWCHPTNSSSVVPFSSCPQSLPASGSFPMSQFFFIRWPNYWSFSISPSNEYSWLISFRIDWFDLLAVQGTLKSLLQHHSSKSSVL